MATRSGWKGGNRLDTAIRDRGSIHGNAIWVESLTSDFYGAPGMTRTCDLLVRSQTLYPTELRARDVHYSKSCLADDDSSFGVELEPLVAPHHRVAR